MLRRLYINIILFKSYKYEITNKIVIVSGEDIANVITISLK